MPLLIRKVLATFLPLAITIVMSAYFLARGHETSTLNEVKAGELLNVGLGRGNLDSRLLTIRRDLLSLAGNSALLRVAEAPEAVEIERVIENFTAFSNAKGVYDQIRWISADGQEIVRVDLINGVAKTVEQSRLQNKADRYYFADAIKLAPGQVYISKLDLNLEHGEIERPLKPMLRVATPIAKSDGSKGGILILNYLGSEMLTDVRTVTAANADRLTVVNQDGYFLLAPNTQDEWGFMFDRPDLSLANRYPSSWSRIANNEEGQFEDENGLWTSRIIELIGTPAAISAASTDAEPNESNSSTNSDRRWIVVSHLSKSDLATLQKQSNPKQYAIVFALLIILAIASWLLARAHVREANTARRYRTFFEQGMIGMAEVGRNGCWQVVNPALCEILGCSEQDLLQKPWTERIHPDDIEASNLQYARLQAGEINGYSAQKRYIQSNGQVIDTMIAIQTLHASGQPDRCLAIIKNVTEQIAAERAVRNSEERIRLLGDNLPDSYLYEGRFDEDGQFRFIYVSSGLLRIEGLEPDAVIANPALIFENTDPAHLPELKQRMLESLRALTDFSMEIRFRRVCGDWGWLSLKSRPRHLANGEIVWDGVATDITAQRLNQDLLKLQTQRAETMLDLPRQCRVLTEKDFMQYAVDQIEKLTESRIAFMHFVNDDEETIELSTWSTSTLQYYCTAAFDNHYPLSQAGLWADAARSREAIVVNNYASASGKKGLPEGHSKLERIVSVPVVEDGQVKLMTGVGNKPTPYTDTDIETVELIGNEVWRLAAQQRFEHALQIANQVVTASAVVCFRWGGTADWPVVYVSDNVSRWGYLVDDLTAGKIQFSQIIHPDDITRVTDEVGRNIAEGLDAYDQEYRLLTASGKVIWVFDRTTVKRQENGEVIFYDGLITDITERKRYEQTLSESLEAQKALNRKLEEAHNKLLQSEKMAAIGQLAAGVAHELNNPISFVHSNLGTLDSYVIDLMSIINAYDMATLSQTGIEEALKPVEKLKQTCDFAYIRQDIEPLLAESKDGLSRVRKIVQDLKSFSHASDREWSWTDVRSGLDSTLNIIHSELKFKCEVVKLYEDVPDIFCIVSQLNQVFMNVLVNAAHAIESQGTITIRTAARDENEILIEISDTGHGIPSENLTHIFDPFFTTKPVGKGTGLGLSIAYGIVQEHQGRIEVESVPGEGSTFRIVLPVKPSEVT